MLLEFMNFGNSIILLGIAIILFWFALIVYCIRDIALSKFSPGFMTVAFLFLVIVAPVLGCIVYLAIRNRYKISVR